MPWRISTIGRHQLDVQRAERCNLTSSTKSHPVGEGTREKYVEGRVGEEEELALPRLSSHRVLACNIGHWCSRRRRRPGNRASDVDDGWPLSELLLPWRQGCLLPPGAASTTDRTLAAEDIIPAHIIYILAAAQSTREF